MQFRGIIKAIKPIYKNLSNPEALKKYLHEKTRNVNEALNAMIWERCPKTYFAFTCIVVTAVKEAVACFNFVTVSYTHLDVYKRQT